MPISTTLLPAHHYRRERWRNQQGWTREILRVPAVEAYDWRVSIAEITQNTLFSPFPGCRRAQVLLQGAGLRLGFADAQPCELHPPHGVIEFDGTTVASCELHDGPVQVFNAIWNPARVSLQLLHRPLVGAMVFPGSIGCSWLLHLLAGAASTRGNDPVRLEAGDSLLLQPVPGARCTLDGAGELLALRITAARFGHGPDSLSLV